MKDVETIIEENYVIKVAQNPSGLIRIAHEATAYGHLIGSPYIANILARTSESITLEKFDGQNAKEWLSFNEDWTCKKAEWNIVREKLKQYIEAETDFLDRGVMYRDLNLEHIIFTEDKAVLVDLEEAVFTDSNSWYFKSRRGTWETMALEEFLRKGQLTKRTATYRVAVVAHLALTGRLPSRRMPLKHDVHQWRKHHNPLIDGHLPKKVRKIFAAALSRKIEHRHKDPKSFYTALEEAYKR